MTAAVMAVTAMAGCGASGGGSGTDSGSGAGGGKTISVAIWDPNQLASLQQIADEWGAENGYTVEFTVPGWDGYWTMLEAGVSGGEMPDVFWMHSNNAAKYMGSGVLLNMDSYIEADESIDLGNYFEGINELYTYDGSHYAIPKDHDTIAVVYNKAIFDKYGVAYPTSDWTWEDFAALSRLQGQFSSNYPQQMAGAVMAVVPMLVLYLIFQKQFVEGIASSGGKL